jgi:hypothetical protein
MTDNYIDVFNPTGKVNNQEIARVASIGDLDNKVIGLIDNGKPNYDIFLARLEELLSHKFNLANIINVKKVENDTGAPLNRGELEKLAAECQVVINGICD